MNASMKKDYSKIKELLEHQENFPLRFTFKFIGRNSSGFARAVESLEGSHPKLRHESTRESSGGKHLAKTYVFEAADADAIIAIYRAIETLEDVMIVL
jgi:putative lipoic acid-binding regulatory protein